MTSLPLVLTGAVNWDHPEWRGSLYPEDLPDDWLLSYYNTQFQAVYLPAAVWQVASDADWAQWLQDTQDGFCFVLEPGGAAAVPPASPRILLAMPAWSAEHVWWLDEAPDLRILAQRITQQAGTGGPLFVISRSANLGLLERVNTLRQVMGY
ncbi:MAG: hypothetical protein HY018_09230 [Hydrogenophilales bacterium]|nr:hypothetical protein [Hydrogenophilales bacterium]